VLVERLVVAAERVLGEARLEAVEDPESVERFVLSRVVNALEWPEEEGWSEVREQVVGRALEALGGEEEGVA
jgi:hypothetical protein